MTNTETLIILAGGASSRMKKALNDPGSALSREEIEHANRKSKGLIPLGKQQRPLLDYVLYNAREAGYKKVVIITGENGEDFRKQYGENPNGNSFNGLEISFATQKIPEGRLKPLGTADALLQAMDQQRWLRDTSFVVCNSDNLYSEKAFKLLKDCATPNTLISYDRDHLKFKTERINRFALMKLDENDFLLDIIEKPSEEESLRYADKNGKFRVSMNIFRFHGEMIYPFLRSCPLHPVRQEKEIPSALLNLVQAHRNMVKAIPLSEHVPDLTSKEDISILKDYLEAQFPSDLWKL